ncbi:MAG: glycosyltransferase family 39 protein [Pyrinomonadaceae bacterium]
MAVKEGKDQMIAAAAFAIFAVVCLVAFLANRGEDVGRLGQLAGSLGGGPWIGGGGLRDSLFGILTAVVLFTSWTGLGNLIVLLLKLPEAEHRSQLLEVTIRTAVGAAAWSLIWFALGVAGLYTPVVAAAAVAVGLGLAIVQMALAWRVARTSGKLKVALPVSELLSIGLIALAVTLALVGALAPPTAKDTLLYHFAVPRMFIAQSSNTFIDGNIASYLALGTEMHVVWAMLLGGFSSLRAAEAAAGATVFLFFPLLLAAVYGWAREIDIPRRWALVAVLMVATIPTAFHIASSGYGDLALGLFVTLATYSLSRWWRSGAHGWLVLFGIFLGGALSNKLTAVFVMAAFSLVILLRARASDDSKRVLAGGFAALLLACVLASPWYLRTWKETGSPVFPFYMSIWKGEAPGWDVERSSLFQGMNSQYGGIDKNKLNYLTAPARVSIAAQPEQPANYDGVLGAAFLVGLPILIWAVWKFDVPVEAKIAAGVAGIMYLFWLFSGEQLRYLLPIAPLLAVAIAASALAVGRSRVLETALRYSLTGAASLALLTTVAWFLQRAPVRVVLGGETRDEYLTRNLDYYPYYQAINTDTGADAKVWLINMRRDTYHAERQMVSDYLFEDWTLKKMVWESRSAPELKAKTAALGIQYVLARHDFLFDYDKSSLVDDARPRAENEAKLRITKEFILDRANTIRSDKKFSLVKVF